MAQVIVILPWPPAALSPNARGHWAMKHTAFKKAKSDAYWSALEALGPRGARRLTQTIGGIPVRVTLSPPDARRRDADNILASCKAYLDGIAQAVGLDDRRFNPITVLRDAPVKGGAIAFLIGDSK